VLLFSEIMIITEPAKLDCVDINKRIVQFLGLNLNFANEFRRCWKSGNKNRVKISYILIKQFY